MAKKELLQPDYLFEVSWEVCNKVGGIYTVLSSIAKTLAGRLPGDGLCFVGPDIWGAEKPSPRTPRLKLPRVIVSDLLQTFSIFSAGSTVCPKATSCPAFR